MVNISALPNVTNTGPPILTQWDARFFSLAMLVSTWSKDPSRQVGAVIVRKDRTIVSVGYNGFARGVGDNPERYTEKAVKYEMVVHAEVNAILTAKEPLDKCTLYSTLRPCSRCASVVINSGLRRVRYIFDDGRVSPMAFELSDLQFTEARVESIGYTPEALREGLVQLESEGLRLKP